MIWVILYIPIAIYMSYAYALRLELISWGIVFAVILGFCLVECADGEKRPFPFKDNLGDYVSHSGIASWGNDISLRDLTWILELKKRRNLFPFKLKIRV